MWSASVPHGSDLHTQPCKVNGKMLVKVVQYSTGKYSFGARRRTRPIVVVRGRATGVSMRICDGWPRWQILCVSLPERNG